MSSSYLSGQNRRREGQHEGKWWSSWVLPRVTPGSSHVASVFGGAPVLTASQCWQASWTERFWTPDWNRAFSEMDCQFAKGGRALGISDIGCTQECKKLSLFLQLTGIMGALPGNLPGGKCCMLQVLSALCTLGKSEPWEPTAWVPCSGREAFFAVSWSASEREPAAEGVYLLSLPCAFCTRGTSRRQK